MTRKERRDADLCRDGFNCGRPSSGVPIHRGMGAIQPREVGIPTTEQSGARAAQRRGLRTTPACRIGKGGIRHTDSGCLHVHPLPEGSGVGASPCSHQEGDQGV